MYYQINVIWNFSCDEQLKEWHCHSAVHLAIDHFSLCPIEIWDFKTVSSACSLLEYPHLLTYSNLPYLHTNLTIFTYLPINLLTLSFYINFPLHAKQSYGEYTPNQLHVYYHTRFYSSSNLPYSTNSILSYTFLPKETIDHRKQSNYVHAYYFTTSPLS